MISPLKSILSRDFFQNSSASIVASQRIIGGCFLLLESDKFFGDSKMVSKMRIGASLCINSSYNF